MMAKISFKLKNLFKGHPRRGSFFGSSPKMDWPLLLGVFVVLNIMIAVGGFYIWSAINRGEIFQIEESQLSPLDSVNREALDKALEGFAAKKRRFDELKREGVEIADPSL